MTSAAAAGGQKPLVSVATLLDRLVTLDLSVVMSAACAVISAVRLAVVAAEAVDAACMAAADVAACEMMLALRLAAVAAEAVAAAVMVAIAAPWLPWKPNTVVPAVAPHSTAGQSRDRWPARPQAKQVAAATKQLRHSGRADVCTGWLAPDVALERLRRLMKRLHAGCFHHRATALRSLLCKREAVRAAASRRASRTPRACAAFHIQLRHPSQSESC